MTDTERVKAYHIGLKTFRKYCYTRTQAVHSSDAEADITFIDKIIKKSNAAVWKWATNIISEQTGHVNG